MSADPQYDSLKSLLREWESSPSPQSGTADTVLKTCRDLPPQQSAHPLRLTYACLAFGLAIGAAYAEWFTIRHESVVDSSMSHRYLASINPFIEPPTR